MPGPGQTAMLLPTYHPPAPNGTIYIPAYEHHAILPYFPDRPIYLSTPANPTPTICTLQITENSTPVENVVSRRKYRSEGQKVEEIIKVIMECGWTLGEALYHLFQERDSHGQKLRRSESHTRMASHFLSGRSKYTTAHLLDLWFKSRYGLPKKDNLERSALYSTTIDYHSLMWARPIMTTFAISVVHQQLLKEVKAVVKPDKGLQVARNRVSTPGVSDTYGLQTFKMAQAIFEQHQPLAWFLLLDLATPTGGRHRDMRPPNLVITQVLSSVAFSRNSQAKLLAADFGVLLFACRANRYLHSFASRLGLSTSYDTTYKLLQKYAQQDLAIVRSIASSNTAAVIIRLDNVQTYVRPRDLRIGREAHMLTGTAATAFLVESFSPFALDLTSKHHHLTANQRQGLDFATLWAMIDHARIKKLCVVQWLRTLIHSIPCLSMYKPAVAKLYQDPDIGAIRRLPPKATQIFALPTNGRNETMLSELVKSLREILNSIGFTRQDFPKRLILVGGDGLTYERMVQAKNLLRITGPNEMDMLDILEPFLEVWHTEWTDISRICEAHWDSLMSKDPSSLGHSANQINRKAPSNLKKVDYYPYSQLIYQVLDARILDCWRLLLSGSDGDLWNHFASLSTKKQVPTFDDLYRHAGTLYDLYGSLDAFHMSLHGDVSLNVPRGSEAWSGSTNPSGGGSESAVFKGDATLARSTRFIHDAMISREAILATAEGDSGRVWEFMKYMIFAFAGSSHTKYSPYLLEQLCNFELEASPELRDCFLNNLLVNPSGLPGHFIAGDKFQEQLQDELYDCISSDAEFDDTYVRTLIAPNVYRFEQIKKNIHKSLGLSKRAGKHIEPHANPEIRRLLAAYKSTELHSFIEGRSYHDDNYKVDDWGRGVDKLKDGRLKAWTEETIRARGPKWAEEAVTTSRVESNTANNIEAMELEMAQAEEEEEEEDMTTFLLSRGHLSVVDGEIIISEGATQDDINTAGDGSGDEEDNVNVESEPDSESELEAS